MSTEQNFPFKEKEHSWKSKWKEQVSYVPLGSRRIINVTTIDLKINSEPAKKDHFVFYLAFHHSIKVKARVSYL